MKLLREKGPEAVRGIVPEWMLPKKCPHCRDIISGPGFLHHVRKHETDIWVPQRAVSKDENVISHGGKFTDTLRVFI